jgi:hypothetical protein
LVQESVKWACTYKSDLTFFGSFDFWLAVWTMVFWYTVVDWWGWKSTETACSIFDIYLIFGTALVIPPFMPSSTAIFSTCYYFIWSITAILFAYSLVGVIWMWESH